MHWYRRRNPALPKVVSLTIVTLAIAAMTLSMVLLPHPRPVIAQTSMVSIQRVSVPSAESDNACAYPGISGDGRHVAFQSDANNLVLGDSNGVKDVFVRDRQTGELTRVSVASDGTQGDGDSFDASINADGRYVAFWSDASNLVASDNNAVYDVFVHDRQTGETTRVSVDSNGDEANDGSFLPCISADGRYVAFTSYATDLVTGDTNDETDIFVHDRQTGETTRVNLAWNGGEADNDSNIASISADGRYVAFESYASNLVAGGSNAYPDIFVHDRQTGETTRVSVASDGTEGDDSSFGSRISADGRYVTFISNAANLVADDDNDSYDVFVHDRQTGETTRVSVAAGGAEGNGNSDWPSISADGRYVTFYSVADNLVAGDTNATEDVFVHDRQIAETTRLSVASDTTQGNDHSYFPSISADGRYVAFESYATNLVADDTNDADDIFVYDRQTEDTTRVSLGWDGAEGDSHSLNNSISADGRYVAFQSGASNLVAGDSNGVDDVFVHDRQTGVTTSVSVSDNGTEANDICAAPSISGDGRYVTFQSDANNLVSGDSNGYRDIFVHDRQTGETIRVSVDSDGYESDSGSYIPRISADGRYVVFQSTAANLVDDDTNGESDVFVHDLETGETTRVSLASDGTEGNDISQYPAITADGQYVSFQSWANNLVDDDTNDYPDVFVRDLQEGETTRVSVTSDNSQSDLASFYSSISADGRYVAFGATATNLVDDDTNDVYDIFVRDREMGETTRVSVGSDGTEGNGNSYVPSISADGRYVTFNSEASNLVADDTNDETDIFVHDRQTGGTIRVSVASDGSEGDSGSSSASISGEGQYVAFGSSAANLVTGDTNGRWDVFVVSWENPALGYAPTSIDFGLQYQYSSSSQILQVLNSGTGALSYILTEDSTWCSVSPDAGDSSGETDDLSVTIDTSGLSPGSYSCVVLVASDGGLGIVPVYLSVQPTPVMEVTPASHAFVDVAVGSSSGQTFTVSNNGTADLVIGTVAAANPLAAPFIIGTDNCSNQTIATGDSRTLVVQFNPTVEGRFNDSFNIPSNDPNTPSVTVTLTGATPNVAPTAPVVDVTPDSPTTANDLVCGITTQSTDADGDIIIYTYRWYKDGVLQSSLTTNTVAAANTTKGQVWKCVVAPNDGTVSGPSAEDQVTIQNTVPAAPVVAVTPDNPDTGADLTCSITTQSTDADGDTVTYTHQWYKDGAVQSTLTTNTVPAASTAKGEVWKCVVTPGDGTATGSAAEDQVTIQNSAPAAPVVAITPDSPGSGADLVCSISTQSADADGDAIAYTYQWYRDGVLQSGLTANTVGAAETAKDEVWKCVVTPSDGTASGPSAEDEVTVTGSAGGFPAGAIAGIVIGVLVLAAAAALLWFRHSKKAP